MNKPPYRASEARAAIGCRVTKLYELINKGTLDARRFAEPVGGVVRFAPMIRARPALKRLVVIRQAPQSVNKIERRMFCHIPRNWRGRPLTDRLAVVELIDATTTKTGLKAETSLDTRTYQKGIKVSDATMKCLDIPGDRFHPEWNYTIKPRPAQS